MHILAKQNFVPQKYVLKGLNDVKIKIKAQTVLEFVNNKSGTFDPFFTFLSTFFSKINIFALRQLCRTALRWKVISLAYNPYSDPFLGLCGHILL